MTPRSGGRSMMIVSQILVAFVALEHLGFLTLEMYFWDKPLGLKVFRQTPQAASATKALAANQGLYNGFLAAGLIWSLFAGRFDNQLFFLGCVIVAGLFGAATALRNILYIQALPAALAFAAVWLAAR